MGVLRILLVVAIATICHAQEDCPANGCTTDDVALIEAVNTQANNYYYIGGMLNVREKGSDPYTCGKVTKQGLLLTEAFFWAIKNYPARLGLTNIINPISVGGFIMDSCSRVEKTIEDLYSFETCRTQYTNVSPRNTVAMVGPYSSSQSIAVAPLLQDMRLTTVSSTATSPELSNDQLYQYFLRTVPSDALQTEVMAKLMQFKSIQYVQVIYQDDAFGIGLFNAFKNAVDGRDVCITSYLKVPLASSAGVVEFLRANKQTKYVVVLGTGTNSKYIIQAADGQPDLKGQFAFVGTLEWGQDPEVIRGVDSAENAITVTFNTESLYNNGDVQSFYDNLFLMDPDSGSNIGGQNVNTYNPWFTKFWEEQFNCGFEFGTCNLANQRLQDKITDRLEPYVPYTLMAVEAIIRGVKDAAVEQCNNIHICSNLLNPLGSRGTVLRTSILNATNAGGNRFFATNGDAASRFVSFSVYQVKGGQYIKIMNYDASTQTNNGFIPVGTSTLTTIPSSCPDSPCLVCGEKATSAPTTASVATTKAPTTTAAPLNKTQYMAYIVSQYFEADQEFTGVWREQYRMDKDWKTRFENGHEWIIALGVCAGLGILCVLVFEFYILYKLMGTKIGKQWRTMWLGQLLLFGLFCAYLVLIAFLFTPSKATCGITRFGVGVSYAMCFGVLIVKLMVLLTSKTSADTLVPGDVDSPNYLRGIYQFLMYIFIVGVQVVIEIQWLIQVPPEAVQVSSNNGNSVWICNHYTWELSNGWSDMTMFVRTDFENHLISLVYVMFLILLTTIIAMKAHGIITNHRESVFIGIAAGCSIPVWVTWGLIGGLNKHHEDAQEFGDASIAFGLFITATIVLFAMFLPKVRQLVNMGVEGIYLEDDRDTYYAGSVVMAPPSYKSRPSSVIYMNSNGYNDPVIIGDQTDRVDAVHLRHPGSTYSAPVYVKRGPESTIGTGKILRVTGDLTGKHPRESKKSMSEAGYQYAGSAYGTYKKSRSESGGTLRRAHSTQDLGAL